MNTDLLNTMTQVFIHKLNGQMKSTVLLKVRSLRKLKLKERFDLQTVGAIPKTRNFRSLTNIYKQDLTWTHVGDGGSVGDGQCSDAFTKKFDEFSDDADLKSNSTFFPSALTLSVNKLGRLKFLNLSAYLPSVSWFW